MEENEPIAQEELSEDLEELFANSIDSKDSEECTYKYDLGYEIKTRYRFARRQVSALLREKFHNKFTEILYVTTGEIPYDYISAFRMQYPNTELKVVIPIIGEPKRLIKTSIKFKYYLQNKVNHAKIYKLPHTNDNIIVYGIYSESFSNIDSKNLFKDIKYLSQYLKCVRILGKILRPDIIHSDIVPFFLGSEFEPRKKYPAKVFQTVLDFSASEFKFEPFWAVLNMADKSCMKKLYKDKIIKKCVASLFKQKDTANSRQMRECFESIYLNYITFRSQINTSEDFEGNTIFERLNERTLKLFPQITIPESKVYNPIFNGIIRF